MLRCVKCVGLTPMPLVSKQQAVDFLKTVSDRSKGQIESPILETLLMCNPSFIENPVEPNNQITLSVRITAPHTFGTYTNYFRMTNDKGQFFGDPLSVKIKVVNEADLVYPRW